MPTRDHVGRNVILRHVILRSVAAVAIAAVWACGPKQVVAPAPSAPVPVAPVPVPVSVAPMVFAIPARMNDTRYTVQSVAEVERDSSGKRDTQRLSSQAQVVVGLRRRANGGFQGTGRVYKYAVSSALSAPLAIDSVRFEAVLDSAALRVVTIPPLANECDRPESGALGLARGLLIRVPASVSIGDHWRDSTIQIVCRASLQMVVRTAAEYVVTDTVSSGDGVQLVIRRTSTTRVEGKNTSPWRAVEAAGNGSATLTAHVSVKSGAVQRIEETSTLTLTVTDRSTSAVVRTQQVTQRMTMTAAITGN